MTLEASYNKRTSPEIDIKKLSEIFNFLLEKRDYLSNKYRDVVAFLDNISDKNFTYGVYKDGSIYIKAEHGEEKVVKWGVFEELKYRLSQVNGHNGNDKKIDSYISILKDEDQKSGLEKIKDFFRELIIDPINNFNQYGKEEKMKVIDYAVYDLDNFDDIHDSELIKKLNLIKEFLGEDRAKNTFSVSHVRGEDEMVTVELTSNSEVKDEVHFSSKEFTILEELFAENNTFKY